MFGEVFDESFKNVSATELTEDEEERRREILRTANHFWELGMRCIPVHYMQGTQCSCGKAECGSPGKHPVNLGWQAPERDADADARWWRMLGPSETAPVDWSPRANLGVLTGEISGVFVLDVDPLNGGDVFLQQLEAQHPDEPIPATFRVRTGSGGDHYYFTWPGFDFTNCKPWGASAGLDIKAGRGQVVAPPSVSGRGPYSFVQDITSPNQIARAPSWIIQALQKHIARQHGEPVGDIRVLPDPLLATYVRSALSGEASAVRFAPEGVRNIQLNNSALSLGSLGAHGLLFEEEAKAALESAALAAGLLPDEIRQTFSSGWRAGLEKPRDLSNIGELNEHEWPMLPWDEFGLGDRLVNRKGSVIRWVESWQSWMLCLNGAWQRCSDASTEMLAQWMIRSMYEEEKELYSEEKPEPGVPSPREKFRAWWKKQRKRSKIVIAIQVARDHPSVRATESSFDDYPLLLNVANGIVDLETGTLKPHDPDLMMTRQCPVSYSKKLLDEGPLNAAPLWKAFLERVQPDPEMRLYIQRAIGYSITGSVADQVMFLHYGSGANGKSVFHDVLSYSLGPYAQSTPVETLTAKRNDGMVPNDVARMIGKRYLLASEAKEGKRLDWPLLKQLISGDRVAARHMRAEFFEFSPVGKLHLTANHLPPIPGDDPAIWRRLLPIEWPVVIPDEEKDGELPQKLRAEAPAILAWAVQGAIEWRKGGLAVPGPAAEKKEEYKRDEDIISPLIGQCLEETEPASPGAVGHEVGEIYTACRAEWMMQGIEPLYQKTLTAALQKRGFHRVKSNGKAYFSDLRVSAPRLNGQ